MIWMGSAKRRFCMSNQAQSKTDFGLINRRSVNKLGYKSIPTILGEFEGYFRKKWGRDICTEKRMFQKITDK